MLLSCWRAPAVRADDAAYARAITVALAIAWSLLSLAPPARAAAPVFGLADDSELVVVGTIEGVRKTDDGKLAVFSVRAARTLKGTPAGDEPFELVQELLFATTEPLFTAGTRTLVFAAPLPAYTAYRQVLGEGRHLRWTERLDTTPDVASLADPALIEPVARYVTVRDDPEATVRLLAPLLASPVARLRSDALAAFESRKELVPLLDAAQLSAFEGFVGDTRVPAPLRAEMLIRLAQVGAPGALPIAERIAAVGGPLEAAALDALVRLDRVPDEARLLAASRSADPAVRIAATRGLARTDTATAWARLETLARDDASADVRLATLAALADARRVRAVPLFAAALDSGDKATANVAAEGLGRIRTPEAIKALAATLERGNLDAQSAAAFALKRTGDAEALHVLHEQETQHPDPRVRRIIEIALGKGGHAH
jgi:hypothetical protein